MSGDGRRPALPVGALANPVAFRLSGVVTGAAARRAGSSPKELLNPVSNRRCLYGLERADSRVPHHRRQPRIEVRSLYDDQVNTTVSPAVPDPVQDHPHPR